MRDEAQVGPFFFMGLPRAAELCDGGDDVACLELAFAYEAKRGSVSEGEVDPCFGYRLFEMLCEREHPRPCFRLGEYLEHGRCGDADPDRARELYHFACRYDVFGACEKVIPADERPPVVPTFR